MSTMYSIGAMNQLADALENAGFEPSEITKLKQFGNLEGIKAVINGKAEIVFPDNKFWEENGVIYFNVTSDGTTGKEWINRLENSNNYFSQSAKELLLHKSFKPTSGIKYAVAILKGGFAMGENNITEKLYRRAKEKNLTIPNIEIACLIREKFSEAEIKSMGIPRIVIMHKPIKDGDDDLRLLSTFSEKSKDYLVVNIAYFDSSMAWNLGYAFEASKTSV